MTGRILLLVQWWRSGQSRQAAPKVTLRFVLIGQIRPFGQVTVAVSSSTVKSSKVKPPSTAGLSGLGLMIAVCPASAGSAQLAGAYAESP